MRIKFLWLGFAATVVVALACTDDGEAQQGKKGPGGKKGGFRREITASQIVEHIMSFDKNGDGKITADELPERLQHLIAMGDINKDGALDRGEITKLASTLEAFTALTSGGPQPGGFKGGFAKGGFATGGPKGGPGGPGAPKGPAGDARRTLDDLDLAGATREKVDRVLRAAQEKQRRFDEVTRAAILLEMKDILKADDYRVLQDAISRPPGAPPFEQGPSLAGIGIRVDRLQKDLDDFRRKLPQ